MGLKSYYFQIGGLRIPNRSITCQESSTAAGAGRAYGTTTDGASVGVI